MVVHTFDKGKLVGTYITERQILSEMKYKSLCFAFWSSPHQSDLCLTIFTLYTGNDDHFKKFCVPTCKRSSTLRDTGKPKGFSFINFEDQRSTVLSVDNLNGIRLCNRFLKVDHVRDYKPPDFNEGGSKQVGLQLNHEMRSLNSEL